MSFTMPLVVAVSGTGLVLLVIRGNSLVKSPVDFVVLFVVN